MSEDLILEWENKINKVKRFKELSNLSEVESVLRLKYPLKEYFKFRSIIQEIHDDIATKEKGEFA